jgi:plasmid stabilization system protein ParE
MEASEQIAMRFVNAIEQSFEPLRRFPLSGPARGHCQLGR